ncbi:MAG: hypothetical protein ABSB49_07570 [Polyangia bacterium]
MTGPKVGGLLSSAWLNSVGLATLICVGCGPVIGTAPFAAGPDTLIPGDLLGPFDGVVVDAETERPVSGATVFASWAFERGIGLRGPAGTREATVETTADGRYQIKSPDDVPTGGSMRLRRFTIVVYRRGYVGYRSDFKLKGEKRHDFSQHANIVRLVKWQPSFDHRKHLAFLGTGQAITRAAAWEAGPASLEGSGLPPAVTAETPGEPGRALPQHALLDVGPLLSADEVKGVTGFAGDFEVGRLLDRVRSDVYDSKHFTAKGKAEAYDVAIRVWAPGPASSELEFARLLRELPAAMPTEELGDRSARARGGDVLGLAFLVRERGLVVQISCGRLQCTDAGMVLRLGKLVESHLAELHLPWQKNEPAPVSPATTTPPASPTQAPSPGEEKPKP